MFCEDLLRIKPIIKAPKIHRESLSAIIFTWTLTILLVVGSAVFFVTYMTVSFINCQQNLILTTEYTGQNCTCSNLIGVSPTALDLVLKDSPYGRQANGTSDANWCYHRTVYNNATYQIYTPYLSYFYTSVAPILFSQNLQNLTINVFDIFDVPFTEEQVLSQIASGRVDQCSNGYYNCGLFKIGSSEKFTSNDTQVCIQYFQEFFNGTFVYEFLIDYDNPTYRDLCQVSTCQTRQCDLLAGLNIVILTFSIIGTFYAFLKLVNTLVFRIFYPPDTISRIHLSSVVDVKV